MDKDPEILASVGNENPSLPFDSLPPEAEKSLEEWIDSFLTTAPEQEDGIQKPADSNAAHTDRLNLFSRSIVDKKFPLATLDCERLVMLMGKFSPLVEQEDFPHVPGAVNSVAEELRNKLEMVTAPEVVSFISAVSTLVRYEKFDQYIAPTTNCLITKLIASDPALETLDLSQKASLICHLGKLVEHNKPIEQAVTALKCLIEKVPNLLAQDLEKPDPEALTYIIHGSSKLVKNDQLSRMAISALDFSIQMLTREKSFRNGWNPYLLALIANALGKLLHDKNFEANSKLSLENVARAVQKLDPGTFKPQVLALLLNSISKLPLLKDKLASCNEWIETAFQSIFNELLSSKRKVREFKPQEISTILSGSGRLIENKHISSCLKNLAKLVVINFVKELKPETYQLDKFEPIGLVITANAIRIFLDQGEDDDHLKNKVDDDLKNAVLVLHSLIKELNKKEPDLKTLKTYSLARLKQTLIELLKKDPALDDHVVSALRPLLKELTSRPSEPEKLTDYNLPLKITKLDKLLQYAPLKSYAIQDINRYAEAIVAKKTKKKKYPTGKWCDLIVCLSRAMEHDENNEKVNEVVRRLLRSLIEEIALSKRDLQAFSPIQIARTTDMLGNLGEDVDFKEIVIDVLPRLMEELKRPNRQLAVERYPSILPFIINGLGKLQSLGNEQLKSTVTSTLEEYGKLINRSEDKLDEFKPIPMEGYVCPSGPLEFVGGKRSQEGGSTDMNKRQKMEDEDPSLLPQGMASMPCKDELSPIQPQTYTLLGGDLTVGLNSPTITQNKE